VGISKRFEIKQVPAGAGMANAGKRHPEAAPRHKYPVFSFSFSLFLNVFINFFYGVLL